MQGTGPRVIEGERLEAIIIDIGGTLVVEAAPGTPTDDLAPTLRPGVAADLGTLSQWYHLVLPRTRRSCGNQRFESCSLGPKSTTTSRR